jgi:hypothetical protein
MKLWKARSCSPSDSLENVFLKQWHQCPLVILDIFNVSSWMIVRHGIIPPNQRPCGMYFGHSFWRSAFAILDVIEPFSEESRTAEFDQIPFIVDQHEISYSSPKIHSRRCRTFPQWLTMRATEDSQDNMLLSVVREIGADKILFILCILQTGINGPRFLLGLLLKEIRSSPSEMRRSANSICDQISRGCETFLSPEHPTPQRTHGITHNPRKRYNSWLQAV